MTHHDLFMALFLGLSVMAGASAAEPASLRLVPFPKEVHPAAGQFSLGPDLVLEIASPHSEVWGRLLNEELARAGQPAAQIRPLVLPLPGFRLARRPGAWVAPALPAQNAPEAYALEVHATEVVAAAKESAGLFYGLQTLRQLLRANGAGDALPGLAIRDWPSLRWRAFQDDMTRGPSSTLATLKFEAYLGAYLKLNLMTYYMEYQFAFKKHPKIGPPDGSLTPEDLSALVAWVKPLPLDILGNQQSFGHFGHILKHPEYAGLRETAEVLSPAREATYQLLDDLYAEVCPLLPFPWFNVCCDETWGLGTGPSGEWTNKIGVSGVYVRHIRRVHNLLQQRHGKRMMMWGDIILQHPRHLEEVPKDTLMLTWGYDARSSFEDQILPFARSGYEFLVCPGVNNWSRILPDFGVAVTNIGHFVRDGVKHGAVGMLNTDWEDDGEALNALKWHADAWAAECAWNGATTPPEVFNRRVGAVLFGERGDHFGQAVEALARAHRLPGMKGLHNTRFWETDFPPKTSPAAIQSTASNLLAITRPALEHLEACRREARCNQQVLETFVFGARRVDLIGQRMLDGLAAAQLYEQVYARAVGAEKLVEIEQLIRRNRDAHEMLGRQFSALWLAENKLYALDWTLRRYTNAVNGYEALLRKVADARAAAAAGRPLPAPDDVGLALPQPLSRRLQAREILPEALAPHTPWAEPTATHRLGLEIQTGRTDRFDMPAELELVLPEELSAKPVRAFVLDGPSKPREVLAQWDASHAPGKGRLILVLPGPLAKDTTASLHVYLGLRQAPPLLASAVRTWPAPNGGQWFENDRVRLLLGPEGAHVYRWEVKAAQHRDLTMPGESGWAGFSDMAPRRSVRFRLQNTARGPALVEFTCSDDAGLTKTLKLYGGASWIEVFLSEATPIYWDFDDPKNFAADGPTPGAWLFSNGQSGPVGRQAEGVPAQVHAASTTWGVKYHTNQLALGLITPGFPARHLVAPGAGAGGVGLENSPPARHFVTFGGRLEATPAETMNRLEATLDLQRPVSIRQHALERREIGNPE